MARTLRERQDTNGQRDRVRRLPHVTDLAFTIMGMDPRDFELINELFEGEASLKEVNRVLFYESQFHQLFNLRRESARRRENLKRKRE